MAGQGRPKGRLLSLPLFVGLRVTAGEWLCVCPGPCGTTKINEPYSCLQETQSLGEAGEAPTKQRWFKGCTMDWLSGLVWELRRGPCKGHNWASKGCRWGATVKKRKGVLLDQESGICGMWKAEAGVEDWAEVGMARTVWKSLQEGPELPHSCKVAGWTGTAWRQGGQSGSEIREPEWSGAWQEVGLRWREVGGRCSRSQSQLGEGRKEAQSQKPLPGFQPG